MFATGHQYKEDKISPFANIVFANYAYFCTSKSEKENINI